MKPLALLGLLCLGGVLAFSGTAPMGRVALALGLPHLAASLFQRPDWQGVAYFGAKEYRAAAEAFDRADDPYNRGLALAHLGDYAAALEAFDIAVARGHPLARANFDVLAAYYAGLGIDAESLGLFPERKEGPQMESFIARGDGRAAGTGDEATNTNTMLGLAELDSRGRLGVRRVFDDKFIVADERWLEQLSDVPGSYLQARISHEYKQRQKLGLSPPEPEDPR